MGGFGKLIESGASVAGNIVDDVGAIAAKKGGEGLLSQLDDVVGAAMERTALEGVKDAAGKTLGQYKSAVLGTEGGKEAWGALTKLVGDPKANVTNLVSKGALTPAAQMAVNTASASNFAPVTGAVAGALSTMKGGLGSRAAAWAGVGAIAGGGLGLVRNDDGNRASSAFRGAIGGAIQGGMFGIAGGGLTGMMNEFAKVTPNKLGNTMSNIAGHGGKLFFGQ